MVLTAPLISNVRLSGTNFVISGAGGAINWPYVVLAATNLTSLAWTPVATNQFDANGNFNFTNAMTPGPTQLLYKLQLH